MQIPSSLQQIVEQFDQSHLLAYWQDLTEIEQQNLVEQIESISFPLITRFIEKAKQKTEPTGEQAPLSPLSQARRLPTTDAEVNDWQRAYLAGEEILSAGRVGCILVAGGQGSRLGFPHPKGMFPVGPVTDRTLFQIFFEQLLALSNRYGVSVPYYIMTSDATHAETEQFLAEHNWFGYPPEDVYLFQQGKFPAVDAESGKILLADRATIAMSPDGHGGLLQALHRSGLIENMQQRGVDTLFYHQVDNPCVQMGDPALLGFHHLQRAEISTKVVSKRDWSEKVGILAERGGVQMIVEYSDLPEPLAQKTDLQGELEYWAGNIAIHVFSRQLFERLIGQEESLPIHIAFKKVACLNKQGETEMPEAPNAYKFERFIFDAIPQANQPLVIETSREEEFNPVKNASGADSPESSRAALNAIGRDWLKQAGYKIRDDAAVEISPLVASSPGDLADLFPEDAFAEETEICLTADVESDEVC